VHHNTLDVQRVGRRDETKKGRKEEGKKEKVQSICCASGLSLLLFSSSVTVSQTTQRNISEDLNIG